MSPLPVPKHQEAAGNLYAEFKNVLSKSCKQCKAYLPLDWKISEDTVVQPDVLVVCDNITGKFLDFPPMLVVEVLSPSTASKDRGEKMELYASQKVKYYLIVDPHFQRIEIYEFLKDKFELVAVNPPDYHFTFNQHCSATLPFEIWD